MKKSFFILLMIFGNYLLAQSNFGIELRASRNITLNTGMVIGEFGGFNYHFEVTKEGNPITTSYSIGVFYRIAKNHLFKLHFGWHQNGRIYSLIDQYDTGAFVYENADFPYHYYQLTPSYCYQIPIGRWRIPIELGVNINKRTSKYHDFYFGVKEYNYDFRMALGISYVMTDHFSIGINGLFSDSIEPYQVERITGTFEPRQFGIEMSVMYDL